MQNQHCLLEWVWAPSSHQDPSTFTPSFRVFYPDGTSEAHPGMNAEVASFMSQLGTQGYRAATCVNAANWILWTLVRRASAPARSRDPDRPDVQPRPGRAMRPSSVQASASIVVGSIVSCRARSTTVLSSGSLS